MISFTYLVCPKCTSPNIDPIDNYTKCNECSAIFEFEEEITVDVECPKCGEIELLDYEVALDGSLVYSCPSCCSSWTNY